MVHVPLILTLVHVVADDWQLSGQYFVLDGGAKDPITNGATQMEPVPPGQYYIQLSVNPPFTPT